MKAGKLAKLEGENRFKRYYMPKSTWLKSGVIIPPVILLLFASFSLKYLFERELLLSWYAVPYVVLFIASVVFLKMTKQYATKKELNREGRYLICQARNVLIDGKNVYSVFTTDENRHDKYYVDKLAKRLADVEMPELTFKSSAHSLNLDAVGGETTNCYIKVFLSADIERKNAQWNNSGSFQVMFVDKKHVSVIPYSDLND